MLPTGIKYVPCAAVGFDARPWFWIAGGPNPAWKWVTPDERPYLLGNTVGQFSSHLREIRQFIRRHPNRVKKMVMIYAWNEWGEGGAIEPSQRFGYAALDAIRSVFELIPTSKRFCTTAVPGCAPN
jgi:hypothetical protein